MGFEGSSKNVVTVDGWSARYLPGKTPRRPLGALPGVFPIVVFCSCDRKSYLSSPLGLSM